MLMSVFRFQTEKQTCLLPIHRDPKRLADPRMSAICPHYELRVNGLGAVMFMLGI